MKLASVLTVTLCCLLIAFCLLVPSGTTPSYAAAVTGCPGNTDTCTSLIATMTSGGCYLVSTHQRTNPIDRCSTACDGKYPGHQITGTQIIYDYIDSVCPGPPPVGNIIDARPNGVICEKTDVKYGPECKLLK